MEDCVAEEHAPGFVVLNVGVVIDLGCAAHTRGRAIYVPGDVFHGTTRVAQHPHAHGVIGTALVSMSI